MIENILITLMLLSTLYCTFMLFRNNKVHRYRLDLLYRIKRAVEQDGYPAEWEWRYHEYESVSYHEMLNKFWKPLDSFYERDPARAER